MTERTEHALPELAMVLEQEANYPWRTKIVPASLSYPECIAHLPVGTVLCSHAAAVKRIAEVERERDALRADAMRYRFLRASWNIDSPHVYGPDDDCILDCQECDDAVDAAIAALAAPTARAAKTIAERDVLAERRRQIEVEGWTPERDDRYVGGAMAQAAAAYAMASVVDGPWINLGGLPTQVDAFQVWPWTWARAWFKPKDARSNLVRAGALILAEIERLDRAALAAPKEPQS